MTCRRGGRVIRWFNRAGNPIPTSEAEKELAKDRTVRSTELSDGTWVSKVFLALDHRHFGNGPPLLYETAVFASRTELGMRNLLEMHRYSTEAEAISGHEAAVQRLAGERER